MSSEEEMIDESESTHVVGDNCVGAPRPQKQERKRAAPRRPKPVKVVRRKRATAMRALASSRRGRTKGKQKCMRAGPLTGNGFLNFLREFRKTRCCMSPREHMRAGARIWNRMSPDCKKKYIESARRRMKKSPKKRGPRKGDKC